MFIFSRALQGPSRSHFAYWLSRFVQHSEALAQSIYGGYDLVFMNRSVATPLAIDPSKWKVPQEAVDFFLREVPWFDMYILVTASQTDLHARSQVKRDRLSPTLRDSTASEMIREYEELFFNKNELPRFRFRVNTTGGGATMYR